MDEPRIVREEGRQEGSSFYHVSDGFYYHFNGENASTIYFRCTRSSCHGRALLRLNGGFSNTVPHNHSCDVLYSQILHARRRIIEQSGSLTYMSFSDILAAERRVLLKGTAEQVSIAQSLIEQEVEEEADFRHRVESSIANRSPRREIKENYNFLMGPDDDDNEVSVCFLSVLRYISTFNYKSYDGKRNTLLGLIMLYILGGAAPTSPL